MAAEQAKADIAHTQSETAHQAALRRGYVGVFNNYAAEVHLNNSSNPRGASNRNNQV